MEYVWKSSLLSGIFQRLHNEQEYYWPTIYRTGAAVVSTITSYSFLSKGGIKFLKDEDKLESFDVKDGGRLYLTDLGRILYC